MYAIRNCVLLLCLAVCAARSSAPASTTTNAHPSILVQSRADNSTLAWTLSALDAEHKALWQVTTNYTTEPLPMTPDTIFTSAKQPDNSDALLAIDRQHGTLRWQEPTGGLLQTERMSNGMLLVKNPYSTALAMVCDNASPASAAAKASLRFTPTARR